MKICTNGSDMPIQLNQNIKRDKRIIFALCVLLFIPGINNLLNSFLQIGLSITISFLTPITYIFMAVTSVFVLYKYILRRRVFIGIFICFLIGVIISYLRYPEIRTVIYSSPVDLVYSSVNKLFFFCIPSLIGTIYLSDYNALFNRMRNWGRFTVIIGVFVFCFVVLFSGKNLQYMVYSYFMLLPICVCYEHARVNKSIVDFIIAISGTICIIMCGARGAIFSLILYFVIRILPSDFTRVKVRGVIKFFILITLGVIVLLYYEEVLLAIGNIFNETEMDSRFISSLTEGVLLDDNGRESITNSIMKGIRNNPLGYGLYGDRYVVGRFGYGSYTYAHNIVTELLCDFGAIGGSIMIFLLLWRIGKTVTILKNRQEISLILVLLPYGVFQLFFSSSYLENIPFFIIIGLSFFVNWKKIFSKQVVGGQ